MSATEKLNDKIKFKTKTRYKIDFNFKELSRSMNMFDKGEESLKEDLERIFSKDFTKEIIIRIKLWQQKNQK